MARRSLLQAAFLHPPQGGNSVGVRTDSLMKPLPAPAPPPTVHAMTAGAGPTVAERHVAREMARLTPAERMSHYDAAANQPPRPVTGPGAVTSVQASFDAGETSALENQVDATRVRAPTGPLGAEERQVEFRNFRRDAMGPLEEPGDAEPLSIYDAERQTEGSGIAGSGAGAVNPRSGQQPTPALGPKVAPGMSGEKLIVPL